VAKESKEEAVSCTSTTNNSNNASNEENIIELFYIRVISKNTKIDTLFDNGSQTISTDLVKKLNLETVPHHKPYMLGWITKDSNLQVTRKFVFMFSITANVIDEVKLDLVPLDIFGIVLGSPYLYDRKVVLWEKCNIGESLTSVKVVFEWGGKQQKEFDALKQKIISAPVFSIAGLETTL